LSGAIKRDGTDLRPGSSERMTGADNAIWDRVERDPSGPLISPAPQKRQPHRQQEADLIAYRQNVASGGGAVEWEYCENLFCYFDHSVQQQK
jgi:hypothetical protein